jgi:hypothetical protein
MIAEPLERDLHLRQILRLAVDDRSREALPLQEPRRAFERPELHE